jgi:thiol-disulfide isomerase/thioredoxin
MNPEHDVVHPTINNRESRQELLIHSPERHSSSHKEQLQSGEKERRKAMKSVKNMLLIAAVIGFVTSATAQQQKAANFSLKSADGKLYELKQYKGKVVVVNFWATWCGPCRKEIPDFIEAYKKYKNKGLVIIGISVDQDGWTKVTPYVEESKINYPVVLGTEQVVENYGGINAIPTTFIVDKNGYIADQHTGVMSLKELETKLQPMLKTSRAKN